MSEIISIQNLLRQENEACDKYNLYQSIIARYQNSIEEAQQINIKDNIDIKIENRYIAEYIAEWQNSILEYQTKSSECQHQIKDLRKQIKNALNF